MSAVETMLSNFILPLQQMADRGGRVHCSLNLNTETGRCVDKRSPTLPVARRWRATHLNPAPLVIPAYGTRLSARRPNLQNQPALEKVRVRCCFRTPGGGFRGC